GREPCRFSGGKGPRPYTAAVREGNWVTLLPMQSIGIALSAVLRVGLPRPARKAKAVLVLVVNEIDIGIMRTLSLGARADLEIERIALRLVHEMMTVGHAGLEACCVAWAQHGRATVLDQHDLALEHVNELIFRLVPVAQH